jgi:hypothetical protein
MLEHNKLFNIATTSSEMPLMFNITEASAGIWLCVAVSGSEAASGAYTRRSRRYVAWSLAVVTRFCQSSCSVGDNVLNSHSVDGLTKYLISPKLFKFQAIFFSTSILTPAYRST